MSDKLKLSELADTLKYDDGYTACATREEIAVLIEIAQAALAWQRRGFAHGVGVPTGPDERDRLESVLDKVQP